MSTGYDPGGTERLLCAEVGDAESSGECGEGFPSTFLGLAAFKDVTPTPPALALGTSDFSIEVWAKVRDTSDNILVMYTGFQVDDPTFARRTVAGFNWALGSSVTGVFDNRGFMEEPPATLTGFVNTTHIAPLRLGRWDHYVLNFDRDALLTAYVNGTARVNVSIISENGDLGTQGFWPLNPSGGLDPGGGPSVGLDDPTNRRPANIVMGPIATHNRLLTTAEMQESYQSRRVQIIPGVTQIAYNWEVEGEDCWEYDIDRQLDTFRGNDQLVVGAPVGTDGDVFVRDQSGNERHWVLPGIKTSYGTATADKPLVAFGFERFL
jgi:hypothetical protein